MNKIEIIQYLAQEYRNKLGKLMEAIQSLSPHESMDMIRSHEGITLERFRSAQTRILNLLEDCEDFGAVSGLVVEMSRRFDELEALLVAMISIYCRDALNTTLDFKV